MKRLIPLLCLAALLAGCVSVGPDYVRPRLDAPDAFVASQAQPAPSPGFEQAAWWRRLGDPLLDQLMGQAVGGSFDVAQAKARVLQARADVAMARAAQLPGLNVTSSTTSSYSDSAALDAKATEGTKGLDPATTYAAGAALSWELDLFGGLRRTTEAARATQEASEEELNGVVLTLLGDVATNYVALRSAQARLDIARATAVTRHNNVDVTRERFRLGLTSHLDVSQAEAQMAATQADIYTLESTERQSAHRLSILCGLEPAALLSRLSPHQPLPSPDGAFAPGLPSELLERRPDLRQAERTLAAASARIGVAAAGQYPNIDLTMGLGLQGNVLGRFLGLANWYWSVVPALAAPVFDGGKARADVRAKRAAYEESLAKYRQTFLTALEEVENALTALYAEQRRKEALGRAVLASGEALELARERYLRGLTSFLDVLTGEKSSYEAQESLVKSQASELTSLITLYKAMGGGWNTPQATASASRE